MGDIKLFRINKENVYELQGLSVAVEKSLQTLIEKHLESFLGVRFLATEYSTGKTHAGRIDTLGIDENYFPVIIEYKRSLNQNVINQGLYYLDWLLDHKAEFTLLAMKKFGKEIENKIDWTSPRLICIAGNFTKFDEHAIQQINRNIQLVRYKKYTEELILLELVNSTSVQSFTEVSTSTSVGTKNQYKTVTEYLSQANRELSDRFEALKAFLLTLGDDVQMHVLKNYFAFKRIKNFACVEIHPQTGKILVYVKVDPDKISLEEGFTRDVRNIGHYGTGGLEIKISSDEDLERAKPLLLESYELS
jgi:predicted transport protein